MSSFSSQYCHIAHHQWILVKQVGEFYSSFEHLLQYKLPRISLLSFICSWIDRIPMPSLVVKSMRKLWLPESGMFFKIHWLANGELTLDFTALIPIIWALMSCKKQNPRICTWHSSQVATRQCQHQIPKCLAQVPVVSISNELLNNTHYRGRNRWLNTCYPSTCAEGPDRHRVLLWCGSVQASAGI